MDKETGKRKKSQKKSQIVEAVLETKDANRSDCTVPIDTNIDASPKITMTIQEMPTQDSSATLKGLHENDHVAVLEDLPIILQNDHPTSSLIDTNETIRKRGRKPKGGKLFTKSQEKGNSLQQVANIILHLKCSLNDLIDHNSKINHIVTDPLLYVPIVPPNIMAYNSES